MLFDACRVVASVHPSYLGGGPSVCAGGDGRSVACMPAVDVKKASVPKAP